MPESHIPSYPIGPQRITLTEPAIRYQVFPFQLHAHCYTVICYVSNPAASGQVFSLPAWIPGSYRIRDFAKHILEIAAEAEGKPVRLKKIDKHTWKASRCKGPLVVTYRVYARDRSIRGAWLDMTRGFFNGSSMFLRVEGQENEAIAIEIFRPMEEMTRAWSLATVLNRTGELASGFGRYEAPDYETLLDSPVLMGVFQTGQFEVYGILHHVVITGAHDVVDMARLTADCRRICETQMAFYGSPYPVPSYLFMIQVGTDGISGLEHRLCSALQCGRENLPMKNRKIGPRYLSLLRLISHEYFHLWLVKRIRPAELYEADLKTEAYTQQLWIFEGLTAYYEDLLLLRAGVLSVKEYLLLLSRALFDLQTSAGRKVQSVADSSFDAWIKFYHMQEASPHGVVSYYLKGSLIGLTLDLWIRDKTNGRFSLDDVMRALWQRYGITDQPLKNGAFADVVESVTGCRVKPQLNAWVHGVEELPLEKLLKRFGIEQTETTQAVPSLGMQLIEDGHLLKVIRIHDDGAAQWAGLMTGDLIVALDGQAMTQKKLDIWLETALPAAEVTVTFFRDDLLRQTRLRLDPPAVENIVLTLRSNRNAPRAQKLREAWFSPAIGHRSICFS